MEFLDTIFFIFEDILRGFHLVTANARTGDDNEVDTFFCIFFELHGSISGQQRDFLLSKTPLLRGVFSLSVG